MNQKIDRESLLSTNEYVRLRQEWRKRAIPFKKLRTVHIGNNASLIFENEFTVRYQLQEMIRVDKSLERDELIHELAVYNDLIPANGSLKATLMFEFVDAGIRQTKLEKMRGVEKHVWIQVDGCKKVYGNQSASISESESDKASSIYFLSFILDGDSRESFLKGLAVSIGIDHPSYDYTVDEIAPETQAVLMEDLKPAG